MLQELKTALTRAGAPPEEQEGDAADWGRLRVGDEESGVVGMERDEGMREGEEARVLERRGAAAEFPVLLGVPVAVKQDLIHVDGFSTRAGALPGFPALDSVLGMREGEVRVGVSIPHGLVTCTVIATCCVELDCGVSHHLPFWGLFILSARDLQIIQRLRSAGALILVPAAGQQQLLQQASVRWPSVSVPPSALSSPSPPILSSSSCPLRRPPTYFHPQFQIFSLLSLSSAAITPPSNPLAASQTCASISRPASFTATVGFKPSHHRLPASGCVSSVLEKPLHIAVMHFEFEQTFGVISASVRWAALWGQAVLPHWHPSPSHAAVQGKHLSISLPSALVLSPYSRAFPLEGNHWCRSHLALMAFEYARFLDSLHLPDLPSLVSPALMELITTGRGVTEEEAAAGRASCVALRHALQQQLRQAGAQAFIAPAATGVPPPMHQGVGNTGN
ncbi:unnamed protein product [Closterium sp. NIES-53]